MITQRYKLYPNGITHGIEAKKLCDCTILSLSFLIRMKRLTLANCTNTGETLDGREVLSAAVFC